MLGRCEWMACLMIQFSHAHIDQLAVANQKRQNLYKFQLQLTEGEFTN